MTKSLSSKIELIAVTALFLLLSAGQTLAQGDTPCTATSISSNTTCVNTNGTTVGATYQNDAANGGTPSCAFPGAADAWYSFTPSSTQTYTIDLTAGTITDSGMSIYTNSSGCSGTFTALECDDDDGALSMSRIVRSLNAGTTYFIRIWKYSSGTGTFGICILAPPPPPSNDEPTGATTITANNSCNYTGATNANATSSTCGTIPAPGCGNYQGGDVWFAVTTPTSGAMTIDTQTGVITDGGMAVYSGSPCGTMTLIACDDNSSANGLMPSLTLTGRTPGSTLYIRVWEYGNNNNGTFSICATALSNCGNPANNDYCSNPATLTQGPGTFSSSTSSTYSNDTPGNITSEFCGSIENNSWYYFVASSTTASFPFTSITDCSSGFGIQATVLSVSENSLGCCTSFTSMSNCFSDDAPSTVTATGLTVGQTYLLMVDGYAGDACDFTVSGWTAQGILPLELITFIAKNEGEKNKIDWVTATEKNTKNFIVEKSPDGIYFENLMSINAAGNSNTPKNYRAFDLNPYDEITYYRLKEFDQDETFNYSHIIAVDNKNLTERFSNIHPIPSRDIVYFDVYTKSKGDILIQVISYTGDVVIEKSEVIEQGNNALNISIIDFETGVYLLKVTIQETGKILTEKIVKN